jgi:hypothetical protein
MTETILRQRLATWTEMAEDAAAGLPVSPTLVEKLAELNAELVARGVIPAL